MVRGCKWIAVVGLTLLVVGLGVGCSHSHSQVPKVTGTPEALTIVERLKGLNDPPPVIISAIGAFQGGESEVWAGVRVAGKPRA